MILEEIGSIIVAGLIAGVIAAADGARLIASQLYGITAAGARCLLLDMSMSIAQTQDHVWKFSEHNS